MSTTAARAESAEVVPPEAGGPVPSLAATTWALFLGIGLMNFAAGLQSSLLGVRAEAEGFSLLTTGLVMTAFYAGFFAGSRVVVTVLATVGHIRVFAALASTASTAVLVHLLSVNPITWFAMRFVTGACMAGLYVVAESWLNNQSTNSNRGRLLAIYMVVTMAGYGGGQLLLGAADPNSFELFVVASLLVSMALVPMTLSASTAPPLVQVARVKVREIWKIVPTGVVTAGFVGMSNGTMASMGAVYAAREGYSIGRISLFVTAPVLGAVLFQWPIGWLSDRMSRRLVIFGTALTAVMLAAVLAVTASDSAAVLPLMFLFGGTIFPLYSLGIAYTNDWLPVEMVTGASSALVRINGAGAIAGPLIAALLMDRLDASMFFWFLLSANAVIAAWALYATMVRDALPVASQRPWVPFSVRAGRVSTRLIPRLRRPEGPPEHR